MSHDYKKVGLINRWVEGNTGHILHMFPDTNPKKVEKFLYGVVEDNIKVPKTTITNSYANKKFNTDLLSIVEWVEQTKPIIAGFGCLFVNQDKQISPNADMLSNFMSLRSSLKDQLEFLPQGSYEYVDMDRKQENEKINANSYYGCSGAPSSRFFNLATAASTTLTGQSLISTSAQAFESFLSNNVLFYDMNNCMDYFRNILNEKHVSDSTFLETPTIDAVFNRLKGMFYNFKDSYNGPLMSYVMNLTPEHLRRIYYKNNLYAFTSNPRIKKLSSNMMDRVDSFLDPNDVPKSIESDIEELWDLYSEFVHYNHSPFGRIQRLRYHNGRESVVVVDTDSNMMDLSRWVEYCNENFLSKSSHLQSLDRKDYEIIVINIMCYYLTRMVEDTLKRYTERANVPEEYRHHINMKNEFLFTRMVIGVKKKRYITSVKLREGVQFDPEIVDIKGFNFITSTTRQQTREKFMDIINRRIIEAEQIDAVGCMGDLSEIDRDIQASIIDGKKDFLLPAKAKSPSAYKFPLRERVVRGVIAWDAVHPHLRVESEEQVDMVLVNMHRLEDIADLEESHPDVYKRLKEGVYENQNEEIRKKGIDVISIPRVVEEIPEWVIPYINIRDMVNRNISKFNPILESLGIRIDTVDQSTFYSNIKTLG